MTEQFGRLTASIYEAAVFPERWPDAILEICQAFNFWGGATAAGDGTTESWTITPNAAELFAEFAAGGWAARNERLFRLVKLGQYSFVQDFDVFSQREWEELPIFRDFLVPRGYGLGAATLVNTPGHKHMMMTLERRLEQGPVEPETLVQLNALRPHIARALVLSTEVQQQRARDMLSGLSLVGTAAAVATRDGRILSANADFEALDSQMGIGADNRVLVHDPRSQMLLLQALRQQEEAPAQSIPVPARDEREAFVVHVIPLHRMARDLSPLGAALLIVARGLPQVESDKTALLRGLYDLGRAEARLAVDILNGKSLRQISEANGISYETARSTAKIVYAKTGSSGQVDLVRRLSLLARI